MREPIENEYFNWLCAKVIEPTGLSYLRLLQILHTTPFIWIIAGDANRAADGIELKTYFLMESFTKNEPVWASEPCSVLEMLIALANRASFQTDIPVRDWFWEFITNLGLEQYRRIPRSDEPAIADILDTFMWRTYPPDGNGGIFPLRLPNRDQRKVELWFQFGDYLEDKGLS